MLTLGRFLKWPAAASLCRSELEQLGSRTQQCWSAAIVRRFVGKGAHALPHGARCARPVARYHREGRQCGGRADAQVLVKLWIDIAPAIELARQMSLEVVANSTVIRRCSIGTAGPTHWSFHLPREAAPRTPISGAPGTPGARGMPRAPSTPSGGRTPGTPRARAAPRTPTPEPRCAGCFGSAGGTSCTRHSPANARW